jgi:hypothetical protein
MERERIEVGIIVLQSFADMDRQLIGGTWITRSYELGRYWTTESRML